VIARGAVLALLAIVAPLPAAVPVEERVTVAGLAAPGEILIDRWGVPHIYAKSARDAFFLQGWNAARDRLWQIDLWRRNGLGQLAEALGEKYAAKDRATRLFVYRGDMAREWAAYGPDARTNTEAFVAGINAFVVATRRDPALLPPEFRLAGFTPALWQAADVVRVRNTTLVYSAVMAAARAQAACKDGSATARPLPKVSPAWTPRIPKGLDFCTIPPNVLDAYRLAVAPVVFIADGSPKIAAVAEPLNQGSNNWVIAPSKSATGRPILANDPHRSLDVPSLRYIAHLSAPGLDVIGAGEPSIPGLSLGHNDAIAIGLTVFFIAQEDLYVYETDPHNPDRYRYGNGWETMRTIEEPLAVRGSADRPVTLKYTRHGPIILEDPAHHRAYAIRATWLDTGGAPYMGAMRYQRAKTVSEAAAALRHWGEPGLNHVVADTSGRIGWFPAGFTPRRPNTDGLLPLPGDGRYEWNGYLDRGELPSEINPSRGFIASANQMNLPAGYPYDKRPVSFFWIDSSRFDRISEVLDASGKRTVAESARLQNETVSIPARRLARLLGTLQSADADLAGTMHWLSGWDADVSGGSAQAALYEIWLSRHLIPAATETLAPTLPTGGRRLTAAFNLGDIIGMLEQPAGAFGAEPEKARDALVLRTLADAVAEARSLLGPDRTTWRWDRLASTYLQHRLAPLAAPAQRDAMNVGPIAAAGDANVVGVAEYDPWTFRTVGGASVRLVMDVGNWDNSLAINTPGQSGSWTSPHYRDLFPMWNAGQYFPLLYSRAAVEKATERRIELLPAPERRAPQKQ
jgi:penicillin amidase